MLPIEKRMPGNKQANGNYFLSYAQNSLLVEKRYKRTDIMISQHQNMKHFYLINILYKYRCVPNDEPRKL